MDRAMMERLLQRAYLYDDPGAYRAGVEAAWQALAPAAPQTPTEPSPSAPAQSVLPLGSVR